MNHSGLPQGVNAQSISLRLGHPETAKLATPDFQDVVRRVLASPRAVQTLVYGNEQGDVDLIAGFYTLVGDEFA